MEEFKEKILELINSTELPFDAKFYVFKDVFRDFEKSYYDMLKKLQEERVVKDE